MDEISQQAAVVVGVLLACFVGPGLAIGFLVVRKRRARARRRSPIGINLLRGPGHTLREQLDDVDTDLAAGVNTLMVAPLLMLCLFLAQGHIRGGVQGMKTIAWIYVVAVAAVIAYTVRKLVRTATRLDNLRAGFDAELAVGQELDRLMRDGASVFHDVPADQFNIDHVVIAREGVFAVETKGYTKPKQGNGKADATVVWDGKTLRFPTWTNQGAPGAGGATVGTVVQMAR